jgi:ESCRT-I complex subunit MVB12
MNPEFRSITSICVVEDVSKCPLGYTPIVRTHDHELDADLWKDGFFGRRITRYICVSKSQGRPEHVVHSIQILQDKDLPPEGYSLVQQTVDTNQRAFKKKQLAFKLVHFRSNVESLMEVIILNKLKTTLPEGFDHVGDINGMHFCVRKASAITRLNSPSLSYGILPGIAPTAGNLMYPNLQQSMNDINLNNRNSNGSITDPPRPFGSVPSSPSPYSTPYPTPVKQYSNSTTMSQISALEGIPFVVHDSLKPSSPMFSPIQKKPVINIKTESEIENEYNYDFHTERQLVSVTW